jgi:hypothetical protein
MRGTRARQVGKVCNDNLGAKISQIEVAVGRWWRCSPTRVKGANEGSTVEKFCGGGGTGMRRSKVQARRGRRSSGMVEVGTALWQHVRRSPATDGEGS